MPVFPELREIALDGARGLAIGWLRRGARVVTGHVRPELVDQLRVLASQSQVPALRVPCPLCPPGGVLGGRPVLLDARFAAFVASPNTLHLITAHGYVPPKAFLGALEASLRPAQLAVLERDLSLVRRRPGMYVGDTRAHGALQLVLEVVSNCIDQYEAGLASELAVAVGPNGVITVADDGMGLPCERRHELDFPAVLFTTLHDAPTLDGHSPHVHARPGLHGVGLGVVSALSDSLEVTTRWRGRAYRMGFSRGAVASPLEDLGPTTERGTTIRLHPDPEIFEGPADLALLGARLRELKLLAPALRLSWQGRPLRGGGLAARVRGLAGSAGGPVLGGRGTADDVDVDFALAIARRPKLASYVNYGHTRDGGSHTAGLLLGLERTAPTPRFAALAAAHLAAVVHARLLHPRFGGPTRDHLDHPAAKAAVATVVEGALRAAPPWWDWLVEHAEELALPRSAARPRTPEVRG